MTTFHVLVLAIVTPPAGPAEDMVFRAARARGAARALTVGKLASLAEILLVPDGIVRNWVKWSLEAIINYISAGPFASQLVLESHHSQVFACRFWSAQAGWKCALPFPPFRNKRNKNTNASATNMREKKSQKPDVVDMISCLEVRGFESEFRKVCNGIVN